AKTFDGTVSIVQPLIEPLFDGRSAIEVLATIVGDRQGIDGGGYEIVRRTFRSLTEKPFSEWKWKQSLADGIVEGTPRKRQQVKEQVPGAAQPEGGIVRVKFPPPAEAEGTQEVVFFVDGKVHDGRFANNGWLQEMPDPMTRLTWGNAALINEKTA